MKVSIVVTSCVFGLFAALTLRADQVEPEGATNLKLFDSGVAWEFLKNTGEGSFELTTDGDKPIGVMNYDFTQSTTSSTPYVLAIAKVQIPDTQGQVIIHVRSTRKQKVTFRLSDSTGQVHQFKSASTGSGDWEAIKIPLAKKLEHWGGANDGVIHFPITALTLSLPSPGSEPLAGKVEYADVLTVVK